MTISPIVTWKMLLIWMAVGLIAGLLAPRVLGRGYGLASDIAAGLAGSILGSSIFRTLYLEAPFGGLRGAIFVAFVSAALLLMILHLFHSTGIRPAHRPYHRR